MAFMSLLGMSRLNQQLEDATQNTARRLQLGGAMDTAGSDMLASMRGIELFAFAKDPARVQASKEQFDSAAAASQKAIDEVRGLLVLEENKRLISQEQEQLTAWRSVTAEVEQAAARNNPVEAMHIAMTKGVPIYQANTRDARLFRELENQILANQRVAGTPIYNALRWSSFAVLGLALLAGTVLLMVVRGSTRTLRQTAMELSQASGQVSNAAAQISSSSQSLANGASGQAASIQETSASTEEISAMTRRNADDSRVAADLMNETSQVVQEANRTLEQMEGSMQEINASSEKIAKIIKVIDGIAFQTNILALNAAVEAARAGEAGMGFAVVADEVRNLAQRSAQAAKDTANMIEESIARSSEGKTKVELVSRAIHSITDKATAVKALIDSLHISSGEQARGVDQISSSITQLEQVTQNTAASAEETASAGEELNSQAAALNVIVGNLEALVGTAR
jgi:methyl-accepting chemotaxis protein/methyl-accepting chemotaxis protein-1 (serine sensor receptor)